MQLSNLHANRNISVRLPRACHRQPGALSRQAARDAGLRSRSVLTRAVQRSESAFDSGREIRPLPNRRCDSVVSGKRATESACDSQRAPPASTQGGRRALGMGQGQEGRRGSRKAFRRNLQKPKRARPALPPEISPQRQGFRWQRGPLPFDWTRPKARLPENQPSAETRLVRRESLREAVFL